MTGTLRQVLLHEAYHCRLEVLRLLRHPATALASFVDQFCIEATSVCPVGEHHVDTLLAFH